MKTCNNPSEIKTSNSQEPSKTVCGSLSDSEDIHIKTQCSQKNSRIVKKVYPSAIELSTINNTIQCTESSCHEIFTSKSNLNLHLFKTHRKKDAIKFDLPIQQFHCPNLQCIYHEAQHFKSKKLLKQHYLKVHSPKTYICESCNQGFPSNAYKNMHVDYCGVIFKCKECPISYSRYESLLTHARRKDHRINEKITYKVLKPGTTPLNVSKSENNLAIKTRMLKPKPSSSIQLVIISKSQLAKNDQGIQTDHLTPKLKSKLTQINRNPSFMGKDTRQTQTFMMKEQFTTETQTIGDFKRRDLELKHKNYIKAQTSTQTNSIPSKSVSSNTFLDVNDLDSSEVKQSSSSTQTMIEPSNDILYSSTTSTHDSIYTDTSDLITNNLERFDTNFFNCNMETQTDFILSEDLFNYCDYYSNMYTQTCEDMLLDSLELNNIETQTVDDMLKSVESQTMLFQGKKPQMNCRDISHMETQTDMEFKQMLEAINA